MSTIAPPVRWTANETYMLKTSYWADKPGSLKHGLEKCHGLSKVAPIWTSDPREGAILFIFQGYDSSNQLRYYLWNGMADTVAQFVEVTLQNVKDEINSEQGSLKNVKFNDIE